MHHHPDLLHNYGTARSQRSRFECKRVTGGMHQEQFIQGYPKNSNQSDNRLKLVPARNSLTLDEEIVQPSLHILPAGSEFGRSLFLQTAFHQSPKITAALSVCWLYQIPTYQKINGCQQISIYIYIKTPTIFKEQNNMALFG